jgi:hypothetical protein
VNATAFVPLAIAPVKYTMPDTSVTPAFRVASGALVQPFCSVRSMNVAAPALAAPPAHIATIKHAVRSQRALAP